jgi:glutaredoxin-like protein
LLEEVADLSDKIQLTVYNFQVDKEVAEKYKIDKIPATVLEGKKDYGIRYYGIPSGYEFSSLLEDIVDVSKNESGLTDDSKQMLAKIKKPLHLQVFVTPTCPYCPRAVRLAHKLAMENDNITADMVEATEFPHLSMKYNVSGVPRTVVGEDFPIEGAVPEITLVEKVIEAYEQSTT